MALTAEELEQVRAIVRSEAQTARRKVMLVVVLVPVIVLVGVLALHVAVIGGFTVYHLMQH